MKSKLLWLSVLAAPVGNIVWIILISLYERQNVIERIVGRAGMEFLVLSSTFWRIRSGRYPTLSEIQGISTSEQIAALIFCWLLGSVFSFIGLRLVQYSLRPISRRLRIYSTLAVLAAIVVWALSPSIPLQTSAYIEVNTANEIGTFPSIHRSFSQGGEAEMQRPGYFEQIIAPLLPLEPNYIRIDHIYDYYNLYSITNGHARYDWKELDRIVDVILSTGAKPLISLSYLPPAMSEDIYAPPPDLAQWEELVYQTVYHFNIERDLDIEYWEVWNEPNMPSFWHGSLDDYLALYEATAKGALRADPTIKLGGPATASLNRWLEIGSPIYEQNWVEALVRYTHNRELPLDFVSWHYYDPQPENYAWSVQQHQQWSQVAGTSPELLLTEWNWSMAPAPELDTVIAAAHTTAVTATLADQPLEQAFFFEIIDSSIANEGRWGMLHANGVVKSVYQSHYFINQLDGERLQAQSNQAQVGVLASKADGQIRILIWRYAASEEIIPVTLALSGFDTLVQMEAILYELNTDASIALDAQQGTSIDGEPSAKDTLIFSLELKPYDVKLISLIP